MDSQRKHKKALQSTLWVRILAVTCALLLAWIAFESFSKQRRASETPNIASRQSSNANNLPVPDFFESNARRSQPSLLPTRGPTQAAVFENVEIVLDPGESKAADSVTVRNLTADGKIGVFYREYSNKNPTPHCLQSCHSAVMRDAPPVVLQQGMWDEYSKIHDLYNVVIRNGIVHFYGLDEQVILEAVDNETDTHYWIQPYKHYVSWTQLFEYSSDIFRFHKEPFDWTKCHTIVEEPSFMFSPWQPFNTYHAHNDNMFPLIVSYLRAGLAGARKRLYMNLYGGNVVWEQAMLLVMTALPKLFDFRLWEELTGDTATCFRHFRWGRGPMLWYHSLNGICADPPTDFWAGSAPAAAQEIYKTFSVTPLLRPGQWKPMVSGVITALYLTRTGARSIVNGELVTAALRRVGIQSYDCCNFGDIPRSLEAMQKADILWGVHGAGFTNEVYMPAGGLVVEIRSHSSMPEPIYWTGAKQGGHAYHMHSIREYGESPGGYTVTPMWAEKFAQEVLRRWTEHIDTPPHLYDRSTY